MGARSDYLCKCNLQLVQWNSTSHLNSEIKRALRENFKFLSHPFRSFFWLDWRDGDASVQRFFSGDLGQPKKYLKKLSINKQQQLLTGRLEQLFFTAIVNKEKFSMKMFFWRILETSKANKSRIRWNKVRFFSIWFSFCDTRVGVILKKTFVTSLFHHLSDWRDKILKIDSWFYFPSAVKVCRRNSQKNRFNFQFTNEPLDRASR